MSSSLLSHKLASYIYQTQVLLFHYLTTWLKVAQSVKKSWPWQVTCSFANSDMASMWWLFFSMVLILLVWSDSARTIHLLLKCLEFLALVLYLLQLSILIIFFPSPSHIWAIMYHFLVSSVVLPLCSFVALCCLFIIINTRPLLPSVLNLICYH